MASYLTIQEADNLISELYTSFSKERSFWNSLDNSDKQALLNKYSSNLYVEGHKERSTSRVGFSTRME